MEGVRAAGDVGVVVPLGPVGTKQPSPVLQDWGQARPKRKASPVGTTQQGRAACQPTIWVSWFRSAHGAVIAGPPRIVPSLRDSGQSPMHRRFPALKGWARLCGPSGTGAAIRRNAGGVGKAGLLLCGRCGTERQWPGVSGQWSVTTNGAAVSVVRRPVRESARPGGPAGAHGEGLALTTLDGRPINGGFD